MKTLLKSCHNGIPTLLAFLFTVSLSVVSATAAPLRVIFDTDMRADCDDAGALAMLHKLQDMGECEILGVVTSTTGPAIVPTIDAMNAFYGRGNLPIGLCEETHLEHFDPYAPKLAKKFPSDQKNSTAPKAAALYRRLLNASPDKSVTVIVVGYATACHELLLTGANHRGDGIPLTGRQLVAKKVKELVQMGNAGGGNMYDGFNLGLDATSAAYVEANWPAPIVYSPDGATIHTGKKYTNGTINPNVNPFAFAYVNYPATREHGIRASWDQVTAIYAVRGLSWSSKTWFRKTSGKFTFRASGSRVYSSFTKGQDNFPRAYIKTNIADSYFEREIDALMTAAPSRGSTPPPVTPSKPAAPSNLNATTASSSQISVTWNDNTSVETGYQIFRSTDGTNFSLIRNLGANVKGYSDSGLSASRKYFYRVRAVNQGVYSNYSNTDSATTMAPPPPSTPAAPTSLSAVAASSSSIRLTWRDNSTVETGVQIQSSTDGKSFVAIHTTTANDTNHTVTGLRASTRYYFRVRAVNKGVYSGFSSIANAVTQSGSTVSNARPTQPVNLTVTATSGRKMNLNWSGVSATTDGFQIFRSTDGKNFSLHHHFKNTNTSYTDTVPSAGVRYYYKIGAYNDYILEHWDDDIYSLHSAVVSAVSKN
jgi:fibronectin type 3 domain-containing protein/inosine-uridine nucleoside N-ribohydrolase